MTKNQCDGCARGLPINKQGSHFDPTLEGKWGYLVQSCTKNLYVPEDRKMHMISVNNRAVFVTLPAGERPRINGEDLYSLFGIQPGHCIKIG